MSAVLAAAPPKVCQHEELDEKHLCVECGSYVMPSVNQGAIITYYDATLAESRKVTAWVDVVSKSKRTLKVFVPARSAYMEMVRHISDPKLKESQDHCENGAWDYSEDTLQNNRRFKEMEARIAELEEAVVSKTTTKKKAPEQE